MQLTINTFGFAMAYNVLRIKEVAESNLGEAMLSRMSAVIGSGSHCIHGISHPIPIFSSSFLILSGLIFRCLILSNVSSRISLFVSEITYLKKL